MKTLALTLSLACLGMRALVADDHVIVHEWGTFTCLQDDHGHAIGGINVDDEPVPSFICQYANRLVAGQYSLDEQSFGLPPYSDGKGWITGDPNVTMRLETPVIYLYPPKGQQPQSVPPLDIHVDFHGGILSQYYPYAKTNGALLNGDCPYLDNKYKLTADTTTGLTWKGVQLGVDGKLIASADPIVQNGPRWLRGEVVTTDNKVWTTPRETSASLLGVKFAILEGYPPKSYDYAQAEHFLFYRGVGHLDSPLTLIPFAHPQGAWNVSAKGIEPVSVNAAWVVQVRAEGMVASHAVTQTYSTIDTEGANKGKPVSSTVTVTQLRGSFLSGSGMPVANASSAFADSDFSPDNLTKLKASMHVALVKEGLYDDEATAMLKTWDLSYFKSPGLRFFYIVPRAWADQVLPLKITGRATDITRVMVGRIELVTDAQKEALARLSAGPCPDLKALKQTAFAALAKVAAKERQPYYSGEKPLSDLGLPIPPLVQDYLSLGRFRDALIVHEQQQHPSVALAQFIKDNQLVPQE